MMVSYHHGSPGIGVRCLYKRQLEGCGGWGSVRFEHLNRGAMGGGAL